MKIFTGKVVSTKMQRTATVEVTRIVAHPIYKKRVKRTKKYHVHDDVGVSVGQTVKFVDTRPYSKTKKWKIIEVVFKGSKKTDSKGAKSKVNSKKKPG